jgi:hypothetical protein
MEMADSSPECGRTYNLRARKRKYFENDSDSSPIQCGQRNTKSSSERHYTQIKLTCLSMSYMMTHVKSTHLMIKMQTYLYMFMIYVLNIGTITFYYITNLTCIATWPKYTIFGWGCHMELLPFYVL